MGQGPLSPDEVVEAKSVAPLEGARVLVSGASGLIGSHVLPLLAPQADVIALSRLERPTGAGFGGSFAMSPIPERSATS